MAKHILANHYPSNKAEKVGKSKSKALDKAKGRTATAADRKKDPYLSADSKIYKK